MKKKCIDQIKKTMQGRKIKTCIQICHKKQHIHIK